VTTTLYEIGAEFAALEAALTESAGELTPEVEAAWDALGEMERGKVDAYRHICIRFDTFARACEAEAAQLQAKATAATNARKRLMERLKGYMESRGVTELKGELFAAKIQKNGGKAPLALLVPVEELRPEFQRQRIEADTDAIRDALEVGDSTITGKARIEPVGTHLRWK
jgi:hypothetical protein